LGRLTVTVTLSSEEESNGEEKSIDEEEGSSMEESYEEECGGGEYEGNGVEAIVIGQCACKDGCKKCDARGFEWEGVDV